MQVGFHMGPVVLAGEDVGKQWQDHLDQVMAARDNGFGFVSVGTHVAVHPFQYFQVYPWLAALTAAAPEMMLLSSVVLVPLAHPVEIAEQVATLDILSNGNFRFGAGLGYRPVEFEIFETTTRHRRPWFEESITVMRRLWTEESVTYEGRFFKLENARLSVRPIQRPYPPLWIAVNSEPAARRAAAMGDGGPFWAPFVGGERLRRLHEIYEQTRIEHDRERPLETCIAREFSIGRTRARALADGRAGMIKKWEVYAEHGETPPSLDDFDAEARDTFVLGDPAECAEQILRYGEEYGITHMKLRLQYPGMSHESVMERIKLTGDVIERLR